MRGIPLVCGACYGTNVIERDVCGAAGWRRQVAQDQRSFIRELHFWYDRLLTVQVRWFGDLAGPF